MVLVITRNQFELHRYLQEVSMAQFYSSGEVARILSVPIHRIDYAITNQMIGGSAMRIGGKRIFAESDLSRLAAYFGVNLAEK
jgi:hypothetical protein